MPAASAQGRRRAGRRGGRPWRTAPQPARADAVAAAAASAGGTLPGARPSNTRPRARWGRRRRPRSPRRGRPRRPESAPESTRRRGPRQFCSRVARGAGGGDGARGAGAAEGAGLDGGRQVGLGAAWWPRRGPRASRHGLHAGRALGREAVTTSAARAEAGTRGRSASTLAPALLSLPARDRTVVAVLLLLGHGCRAAGQGAAARRRGCCGLVELACGRSQCSARGRACSAASDALRQQSSLQPCCSSCAVSLSASSAIASASVTETTRRRHRRRRGGALVDAVDSIRPAPDAVAARRSACGLC